MKKNRQGIYMAMTSLLFALCCISLARVQDAPVPLSKQASTIPTSDELITLKITLSDGQTLTATEREGGMIRIEKDGRIFGVTPHIHDKDNSVIKADIFRITTIKRGGTVVGESMAIVENVEVNKSFPRSTNSDPPFTLQVERIVKAKAIDTSVSKPKTNDGIGIDPPTDPPPVYRCCVTCGSTTACACAVTLSCGSCCSGPCCP